MLTLPHRRALLTRKLDFDPTVNLLTPRSDWDGTTLNGWGGDELTISGGEFVITGGVGDFGYPQGGTIRPNKLTIGATYRLEATGHLGTALAAHNPTLRLQEGAADQLTMSWSTTTPTVNSMTFTATSTTLYLILFANNSSVPNGATVMFDDINLFRVG